jgi:septum formation protein
VTDSPARLVLASGSSARRTLLENAGLAFDVVPSSVDERAVEAPLVASGATPAEIAAALAVAKAEEVSRRLADTPDALVIGADQTLDCDGHRGTKSATLAAARTELARLAGRSHRLHSAVAVAQGGVVFWRHLDTATLTMRPLSPEYIEAYLGRVGAAVLNSVGVYQLEGEGIRLFERIQGDYFTILGLPLLPLLACLRNAGAIE